jgi:integrase
MATVKFLLQGKSESVNIYVRFSINRDTVLKRKTGLVINPKDWSTKKGEPIQRDEVLKSLKSNLDSLKRHLETALNTATANGIKPTGDWLTEQIDIFNGKAPAKDLDILTNYIDKVIEDAPYKRNQKKETGLSKGRIKNIELFKNTVIRFESETNKGKSFFVKDVNLLFVEKFKKWLFAQNFSVNYVGKNIDNLKMICRDAFINDIETSTQIKNIKSVSETKAPEQIIYLSDEEQEQIKNAPIIREALINARKWLLLGCLIGQRGGDLLNITPDNIREINGTKIIELKQQKTGKLVAIPLLPEAVEIIESGFPYTISLTKFNEYIKDVCKLAGINTLITGRVKETPRGATVIKELPKYELITSHVCRRSFATNFYGQIPTPVLINITAHATEKMFLAYIGKTTYDNAFQMVEYFSKLAPKVNTPKMEVVQNTGTI